MTQRKMKGAIGWNKYMQTLTGPPGQWLIVATLQNVWEKTHSPQVQDFHFEFKTCQTVTNKKSGRQLPRFIYCVYAFRDSIEEKLPKLTLQMQHNLCIKMKPLHYERKLTDQS